MVLEVYEFDTRKTEYELIGVVEDGKVVKGNKRDVKEIIAPYDLDDSEEEIENYLDGAYHVAQRIEEFE